MAADISKVALARAAERCHHLTNISYKHIDIVKDKLPSNYDLIVCSEVLYYMDGETELLHISQKFAEALQPEGFLLMAHAHQIADEPEQPGFDWSLPFGAKKISDVFSSNANLELVNEIRTPLYRVQLYQRKDSNVPARQPSIRLLPQPAPVPTTVAHTVFWQGATPFAYVKQEITTAKLPILMYHRVAPSGPVSLDRYRVMPEAFEEQLMYLKDAGYYTPGWNDWLTAVRYRRPLTGRAIMLTFDDGYKDFYDNAWPLLKKYGFTATVFLVTSQIGGSNVWDAEYGEAVPLMSSKEILELQQEGVEFGAHTVNHVSLSTLSPVDITKELAASRSMLVQELGINTTLIAYPYGATDSIVSHLAGACGYQVGLSCVEGLCSLLNDPLLLPRLEVKGDDSLADFIVKLK